MTVLLAFTSWLALDNARLRTLSIEPDTLMGQFLAASPGPVRFVLTDSALPHMNAILGGPPTLEQYFSREFVADGERIAGQNPTLSRVWRGLLDRQITSLADVGVLTRLLQTHPSSARRIEVRHAKHVRTRDFKTGHFIITGSHTANPWAALFEPGLDFVLDGGMIVDRHPAKGAPSEYRMDVPPRRDWAVVAWVRNLTGTGSVLMASGIRFEGTEGAGEFLLSSDGLAEARRLLQVAPGAAFPTFELLLETSSMEGTAKASRIVAWRRHK